MAAQIEVRSTPVSAMLDQAVACSIMLWRPALMNYHHQAVVVVLLCSLYLVRAETYHPLSAPLQIQRFSGHAVVSRPVPCTFR